MAKGFKLPKKNSMKGGTLKAIRTVLLRFYTIMGTILKEII